MFDGSPGGGSVVYNQTKSLVRIWNRLSRLQRNLISLTASVGIFITICYVVLNQENHDNVTKPGQSDLSNLNQLIHNRLQQPVGGGGPVGQLKKPHLPDLSVLDIPKKKTDKSKTKNAPRNRVEAVRDALDEGDVEGDDEGNDDFDGGGGEVKPPEDFPDEGADKKEESNGAGEVTEDEEAGPIQFTGPTNPRQKAVVEAFQHAWSAYRRFAWGNDHLRPISKAGQNWFGLGLTIVDSLDTMLIMNLKEEYTEARDWVAQKLNFGINKDVNLFETTIRVLGGLLSTYHLTNDKVYLEKATDLADRLMGAFKTVSGIPYSDLNLAEARGHSPKWSPDSSTSEVTTIQLEFRDLSRCTSDEKYEKAVEEISSKIHQLDKPNGLVPIYINPNTGKFRKSSTITLGARGDSYYEYLLKQWVQTGKTVDYLREDFLESVRGVNERLSKRTMPNRLLFVGELISSKQFKPKMDELVCFLPGTLALAAHHGLSLSGDLPPSGQDPNEGKSNKNLLLEMAEELAYTCYLTFARQPTHLAPEITHFNYDEASARSGGDDFYTKPADSHYLLRPETIESLWYLYYVTGDKKYQEWGWNIFQGIEKYTKVKHGYTTIGNVRNPLDLRPKDMMESFFLGETLKYLYLLFADKQELDLKHWVFNTEAHPLPIRPK